MTTTRPPIPARIYSALYKLDLLLPPHGEAIPISKVDKALADAGASLEQKMRFKSDLRMHKLINP
jgi:hypothetical protein